MNPNQPLLRDAEHHILWLVEQRLCDSLDDRHPVAKVLLERGLLEKGQGGLRLTVAESAAIGRPTSIEDMP